MKFSKGGVTIEIGTKLQASAFIQSGWKPVLAEDTKAEAPVDADNAAETNFEADAEDAKAEAPKKPGRRPKEIVAE